MKINIKFLRFISLFVTPILFFTVFFLMDQSIINEILLFIYIVINIALFAYHFHNSKEDFRQNRLVITLVCVVLITLFFIRFWK